MDEKEKLLAGERPRCRLRVERIDLADERARASFLADATRGAEKVLVLAEGLLMYLDEAVVRRIATELHAIDVVKWWIVDLHSASLLEMMKKGSGDAFANAPMKFAPENGVAWFEELGWKPLEIESILKTAAQHRRLPLMLRLLISLFPDPDPRSFGRYRWYGIVRFGRG
jgi:O-methyltransferase involved in polyketide biosynthesis